MEDHAILLCSLLLGFGLDAYVVCGIYFQIYYSGSTGDGPHFWVLTSSGLGEKAVNTFWESLTGATYDQSK